MKRSNSGFTVIEMIMAITLMGVLAAVAMPRFIDMKVDAKMAKASGQAAALSSAVNMAVMKWHVSGQPDAIEVDGRKVEFKAGYPTPDTVLNLVDGLEKGRDVIFTEDAGKVDQCVVAYVFDTKATPAGLVDSSGITPENCK